MVWREKIRELVESAESIELRIYRNRVRDELYEALERKRQEMRKNGRLPYRGEWLTRDEIVLSKADERKKDFAKVVLVITLYLLLFVMSLGLGLFVWRAVK